MSSNPYEPSQSDTFTIQQARSASEPPPYPAWVTRAIERQMLAIALTLLCAISFGSSTSADEWVRWLALGLSEDTWRWVVISLLFLIELLAVMLLHAAIKYRVIWLLISELSLFLPAAIGFIAWVLNRAKQ